VQIKVQTNIPALAVAMRDAAGQVPFATMLALNSTAKQAQLDVQARMRQVFDRPTTWVINSLRVKRATKTNLFAEVEFKRGRFDDERGQSHMIEPHIVGGDRKYKAMEVRLYRAGLLPAGYQAVPGQAAKLDAAGNMSRGQISQLLNVLGTYQESGYNKADDRTRARLAAGNAKKGVYGFVYWVNPVTGAGRQKHLMPGVYQRVNMGFATALKPVLIFVRKARYKPRLHFAAIVNTAAARDFAPHFDAALNKAMQTALLKSQGRLI
jgi:hypothetical protein